MSAFTVRQLDPSTWPQFAELVERHNGVWGGCWCMGFHDDPTWKRGAAAHREAKQERVRKGTTHNALVFDGERCVGWCLFGPTAELPAIKHRKRYEAGLEQLPDWRVTCFFVDREYRKQGVADAALGGALDEIGRRGGGTVESYPEDTTGRKTSSSFLHNGTVGMFERHGFERSRKIGKHHWVVTRVVSA